MYERKTAALQVSKLTLNAIFEVAFHVESFVVVMPNVLCLIFLVWYAIPM